MGSHEATRLDQSTALPGHMAVLAGSSATGVLAAATETARREILYVNGEIRAARSSSEDEKLGMWLVDRGKISEDDRALSLLSQGGDNAPPLGHLLVTRGCLEQSTLELELQELTLAIIRRSAADPALFYEFMDGQNPNQPDTLPNLFTSQIILIAASVFAVVVGLVLIGLAIAGGTAPPPTPTPTATTPPIEPPATIPPTNTPAPPTPEPEPTALPSPTPIPTDPQGDVTGYDGGPPIEDAPAGVQAAHAAGMRAVAVASTHAPEVLGEADAVAARLLDIQVATRGQAYGLSGALLEVSIRARKGPRKKRNA